MEEKEDSTVAFVVVMSMIVLMIIGLGYGMVRSFQNMKEESAARAVRVEVCKALDPKYEQVFTAKEGPFRETELVAVGFSDDGIAVQPRLGPDFDRPKWFYCGDLKEVEK